MSAIASHRTEDSGFRATASHTASFRNNQGVAYWAECLVNDDIISGLQAWSDNRSSSALSDASSVDSVVAKHRRMGVPLRPCFLVSHNSTVGSAEVLALATFGRRPANTLDRFTQHYALSVVPTPSFPENSSPARTQPVWPHNNQYIMLVSVYLREGMLHKSYKQDQYRLLDVARIRLLAGQRTRECASWPKELRDELLEEWKQQRKRLKKAHRKRVRRGKGQPMSALSIMSQSIAEVEEPDHAVDSATEDVTAMPSSPRTIAPATGTRLALSAEPPSGHAPAPAVPLTPVAVPSTSTTDSVERPSTSDQKGSAETRRFNERRKKKRFLQRLADLNIFGSDHESVG
ncbi:hypothetical protein BKA62DRAFT_835364 [Auriculariales sp. MPI-PUGE-AT-0066]|nr:hypothetical protein BKA62DRAFT_835364 [Auriculariales sp. MPI-PUGE-AT-0066]